MLRPTSFKSLSHIRTSAPKATGPIENCPPKGGPKRRLRRGPAFFLDVGHEQILQVFVRVLVEVSARVSQSVGREAGSFHRVDLAFDSRQWVRFVFGVRQVDDVELGRRRGSDSARVDSVSRNGEVFSIIRPAKVDEWRKAVR